MARATRSTTNLIVDGLNNNLNKKRKRNKVEEEGENDNDNDTNDADNATPSKRHASESSIAANDAATGRDELVHHPAILDVLEMIDSQGLLDRVFPVLDQSGVSLSLRTLLQEPRQLSVLRAAVEHLIPLSSAPRAVPSTTAAQQRRFCDLAVSLLDQAATKTTPVPLSLTSILSTDPEETSTAPRRLKYALVQHLPSGDYWTSLNSDASLSNILAQHPTAQAELVAILPTPPQTSSKPVPTLATFTSKQPLTIKPLPTHRTVSAASFLDYGPYSSFAPAFDHNGQVVGREELGEVLYSRVRKAQEKTSDPVIDPEIEEISATAKTAISLKESSNEDDVDAALAELFPADEAASIKSALKTYELEKAVRELLERSRKALVELELMQIRRLTEEGENSAAKEGSAEWDTAQGIMETLTILASLRPRASTSTSSDETPSSLVPSPSILHRLHRTLAIQPTHGWYGTLPPTRATALVDDNTVKRSRSVPTPVPTTTTPAPAPTATAVSTNVGSAAPVTMSQPMTASYSSYYPYAHAQTAGQAGAQTSATPYRPQANGTAATASPYTYSSQYYGHYPTQQMHQNYYGQQQQGYATAAHAYAGWYPYHPQQGGGATTAAGYGAYAQPPAAQAGSSGRGTPVPAAQAQPAAQIATAPVPTAGSVAPGTYGSYFGTSALGQPNGVATASAVAAARTPAVANTAVTAGTGYPAGTNVTLPAHLRTGLGQVPGGYYSAYQPQQVTSMSPPAQAGQT